jgi:hypothetical protein
LPYAKCLPTALAAVHERVPTDGTTIFVAELEAAVALCFVDPLLDAARGVVLCGAGGMSRQQLTRHAKLPILGIPLTGNVSSQSLQFSDLWAKQMREGGAESGFRLAPDRSRPWIAGLASGRAEIAQFVRTVAASK